MLPGSFNAEVDTLLDHRALKFRKGARDLEDQLSHRGRGVDVLLIEIKVNTASFEVLDSIPSKSDNDRPTRSMAQAMMMSNLPFWASFNIRAATRAVVATSLRIRLTLASFCGGFP
jgi:hypothetical protein